MEGQKNILSFSQVDVHNEIVKQTAPGNAT